MAVANHLRSLQSDKSAPHVEYWRECLDLRQDVDDFDDDREIGGYSQVLLRMHPARFPKSHRTRENSSASQAELAGSQENGVSQRLVAKPIAFADKDSQENGFLR